MCLTRPAYAPTVCDSLHKYTDTYQDNLGLFILLLCSVGCVSVLQMHENHSSSAVLLPATRWPQFSCMQYTGIVAMQQVSFHSAIQLKGLGS